MTTVKNQMYSKLKNGKRSLLICLFKTAIITLCFFMAGCSPEEEGKTVPIKVDEFLSKWNASSLLLDSKFKLSKDIQVGRVQDVIQKTFDANNGMIVTVKKEDKTVREVTILTRSAANSYAGLEVLHLWSSLITTMSPKIERDKLSDMIGYFATSVKNQEKLELGVEDVNYTLNADELIGIWFTARYMDDDDFEEDIDSDSEEKVTSITSEVQKKLEEAVQTSGLKFSISDIDEQEYDLYVYQESGQIRTEKNGWACAKEGDRIYSGDYTAALVHKGAQNVRYFPLGEIQFNYDAGEIFIVPGKPDLLVQVSCQSSVVNEGRLWFVQ